MPELTTPSVPLSLDCDPITQQDRQEVLEALYLLDGRDNPAHPMHALYTGLAQQYWSTDAP